MQNRNMYLYRRQGPKKRAKTGSSRKNRGQQKGLPNSARDLLPLIQPATKALAQMLAGRTAASGQLRHAQAILAQTERLVSERAHNRLNPAEREEFFEQIARLKLTLADAESEAEVQAAEDETPPEAPTPVNRERLKEMAMALTSPGGPTSYENRHDARPGSQQAEEDEQPAEPEDEAASEPVDEPPAAAAKRPGDPNQLRLPRASADRIDIQPGTVRSRSNGRRTPSKPKPATSRVAAASKAGDVPAKAAAEASDLATATDKVTRSQKLPKGWIIDDDGFVVPGPSA